LKPESLRLTAAAEANPTRVAMMVDQRNIIMERKWYVALKDWVGVKGKCGSVKPRTSQVSYRRKLDAQTRAGEAFYTVRIDGLPITMH
jgi:hypothetical protein